MSELSHERMRELAPELALDILSGYERATAQDHLNECPECRAYVSSLTQVGDRLLSLVPGVEPPVGFEDRVLTSMGLTPPPVRQIPPPRRRWGGMVAVAAAAALVFGVGGGIVGNVVAHQQTSITAESDHVMRFAVFHEPGQQQGVGQVFAYNGNAAQGNPSWVYMSVASNRNVDWVACQVITKNGHMSQVGAFTLDNGRGSWSANVPPNIDMSTVTGARLVAADGSVLASASFDNGQAVYMGNPH